MQVFISPSLSDKYYLNYYLNFHHLFLSNVSTDRHHWSAAEKSHIRILIRESGRQLEFLLKNTSGFCNFPPFLIKP